MTDNTRRLITFTLSSLLLLAVVIGVSWRVIYWNQQPWVGMNYHGVLSASLEARPDFGMAILRLRSHAIQLVLPDSPAARGGLRHGDLVRSIDGVDTSHIEELKRHSAAVRPGELLHYGIERNGEQLSVPLRAVSPLGIPYITISLIGSLLVGLVYVAISAFIFRSHRPDRRTLVFYLICFLGGSFFLIGGLAELESRALQGILPNAGMDLLTALVVIAYLVLTLVLAGLILHMVLIFPRDHQILTRYPRLPVYIHTLLPGLLAVVFGAAALSRLKGEAGLIAGVVVAGAMMWAVLSLARTIRAGGVRRAIGSKPWTVLTTGILLLLLAMQPIRFFEHPAHIYGLIAGVTLGAGFVLLIVGYAIVSCVVFYRRYRASVLEEKRQLRWPLWGLLTALGGTALLQIGGTVVSFAVPDLLLNPGYVALGTNLLSKLVYVLIPISFAFGIAKYKLMEVDLVIRKTVTYSLVSGLVIILYVVVVVGAGRLLMRIAAVEDQLITIVGTLLLAAVFIPLKKQIQVLVDRKFFRRGADHTGILRELTDRLSDEEQATAACQAAAEALQRGLLVRSVIVFLLEEDGVAAAASIGTPSDRAGAVLVSRRSLIGMAAAGDIERLPPEEAEQWRRLGIERAIGITLDRELRAVAAIGSRLSDEELSASDLDYAATVGERLAVALGKFRLRQEEAEFEQASQIQLALLPREIPQIVGSQITGRWIPARSVGGDYFDVIRFSEGRAAVCIGDVAGKGLAAALLMSSLQATVRAIAESETTPARLIDRVRTVISRNLSGGRFITFCYCVIDVESRTLTVANAGHNQPILLRQDGTVARPGFDGGAALARLFNATRTADESLQIGAGDRLVLFTDGITEAMDGEGMAYGEDRLVSFLLGCRKESARAMQEAVLTELDAFTGGRLQDDLTLIIVSFDDI
jgi:serine phosphatase RsbU (regulator of sigma subunit)